MSGWGEMKVVRSEVELKSVLPGGQSFRAKNVLSIILAGSWKLHSSSYGESEWVGVFSHRLWILKQDDNTLYYKVYQNGVLKKPDKTCNDLLWNYFQLDISLNELYKEWAGRDPKFAELTETDYQGIRVLKQDPIETIFAFICSSNNNISRISGMVEKLCTFYGKEVAELNGKTYYGFPGVESLAGSGVEKKLREEGFGYRAGFISKSAAVIVSKGGQEWAEDLKTLGYEKAMKELQSLVGVGRKVADCICLMALGYHECIPIDTHMHQVGKQYLPHLKSVKTLTDKVYSEISEYFRGIHGDYAGWAHSVLFSSTLRHLKSSPPDVKRESDEPSAVSKSKRAKIPASMKANSKTRPTK